MIGEKKEPKEERDMMPLFCFKSEKQTPSWTMSGNPDSFITTTAMGPKKSREPGPGSYEDKDVQFKKPGTKFTKAA